MKKEDKRGKRKKLRGKDVKGRHQMFEKEKEKFKAQNFKV